MHNMLRLYGHYASQPTRSVAWLLKLKSAPFEFTTINPTAGETRTTEFRSKFPLGLIPALEDTDANPPFMLSEASSILIYLCEKYNWNDYYPVNTSSAVDLQKRAKTHEYFSHHNESSRMMTRKVIFPTMKWMFADNSDTKKAAAPKHLSHNPNDIQQVKSIIRDVAKRFEHKFLKDGNYIVGDTPSIADLLAYPEIAQIPMIMGIQYTEWEELERLRNWLERMEQLDFHDDVHKTVVKIGKMYKSKL